MGILLHAGQCFALLLTLLCGCAASLTSPGETSEKTQATCGTASVYGTPGDTNCEGQLCEGRCMASGVRFSPLEVMAACPRELTGFGSGTSLVVWPEGRSRDQGVTVHCKDTGDFGDLGRILDLSPATFNALNIDAAMNNLHRVCYQLAPGASPRHLPISIDHTCLAE